MISNCLLATALMALSTATPATVAENEISPRLIVYDDLNDTTSFDNAAILTANDLTNAQVYGENDSYDYLKYTAAYSRHIYLDATCDNSKRVTISVYTSSSGFTTPVKTYNPADGYDPLSSIFLKQGETAYFKVWANGNCMMSFDLSITFNLVPGTYYTYEKFHGYSMPHSGPATIYYSYDSSCYQNVPTQNYTFANVLDEAISIWEGCGEVDFVYNSSKSTFDVVIDSSSTAMFEVIHAKKLLSKNWYVDEFNMVGYLGHYAPFYVDRYNADGTPVTIRQAVLADAVCGFGAVLGLANTNTTLNMMTTVSKPYDQLGQGDIGTYMYLWGDANY